MVLVCLGSTGAGKALSDHALTPTISMRYTRASMSLGYSLAIHTYSYYHQLAKKKVWRGVANSGLGIKSWSSTLQAWLTTRTGENFLLSSDFSSACDGCSCVSFQESPRILELKRKSQDRGETWAHRFTSENLAKACAMRELS